MAAPLFSFGDNLINWNGLTSFVFKNLFFCCTKQENLIWKLFPNQWEAFVYSKEDNKCDKKLGLDVIKPVLWTEQDMCVPKSSALQAGFEPGSGQDGNLWRLSSYYANHSATMAGFLFVFVFQRKNNSQTVVVNLYPINCECGLHFEKRASHCLKWNMKNWWQNLHIKKASFQY